MDLRLDRLEEIVNKFDVTLQGLGSAVGHLALLDARADDNVRRIGIIEDRQHKQEGDTTEIRVAIEGLRTRLVFVCGLGSLAGSGLMLLLVRLAGG